MRSKPFWSQLGLLLPHLFSSNQGLRRLKENKTWEETTMLCSEGYHFSRWKVMQKSLLKQKQGLIFSIKFDMAFTLHLLAAKVDLNQINKITELTITTTLSSFCRKNARLRMVGMIFSLRQTLLTL